MKLPKPAFLRRKPTIETPPPDQPPRAVLYLRVARQDHDAPGESPSLRAQQEACLQMAAEMGWPLDLEVFIDEDDDPAGQTGGNGDVTRTAHDASKHWAARAIARQMGQDGVPSFGAYLNLDIAIERAAWIMGRYGLDVTDSDVTDEVIDQVDALREAMR